MSSSASILVAAPENQRVAIIFIENPNCVGNRGSRISLPLHLGLHSFRIPKGSEVDAVLDRLVMRVLSRRVDHNFKTRAEAAASGYRTVAQVYKPADIARVMAEDRSILTHAMGAVLEVPKGWLNADGEPVRLEVVPMPFDLEGSPNDPHRHDRHR